MCLAIVLPAGKSIPDNHLIEGWRRNPDGAGFAYVHKGKVVVKKGFMKQQDFMDAFLKERKKHPNKNFLIHFRIRSQGDRLAANTHPYEYQHGAMIHNGTISGTGAIYGKGKSDTELFLDKYGEQLSFDTVQEKKVQLGTALDYNKLAFLFRGGSFLIVNEEKGVWEDGVWYSNAGYKGYTMTVNGRNVA